MSKENDNIPKGDYSLSTGDLMAAMLFIFILLLSGSMLQLKEKQNIIKAQTEAYDKAKKNIGEELVNTFGGDSLIVIDKKSLCISFKDENVLFEKGKFELKPNFKILLNDFFPKYMDLVYVDSIKGDIQEIKIEGYASSEGDYLMNMDLSQKRAYEVFKYCYQLIDDVEKHAWMKEKITANGFSIAQTIKTSGVEDKELSRRVEFKIITNAEKHINKLNNITQKNRE